jgi:thiopeptide-type bacteriocin biosynthesis protein
MGNNAPLWLSLEIWGTPQMTHDIGMGDLLPIVRIDAFRPWIIFWFFVRYWDGMPQIRFRILVHSLKQQVIKEHITSQMHSYLEARKLWKIQWKPYVPELERYGVTNMETVHQLFHLQSVYSQGLFGKRLSEEQRLIRLANLWPRLLAAVYPDCAKQHRFIKEQQKFFKERLEFSDRSRKAISKAYRELVPKIILPQETEKINVESQYPLVQTMAKGLSDIEGDTQTSKARIIKDILHMHVNKCFLTDHGQFEYLLYEFLDRAYASQKARMSK